MHPCTVPSPLWVHKHSDFDMFSGTLPPSWICSHCHRIRCIWTSCNSSTSHRSRIDSHFFSCNGLAPPSTRRGWQLPSSSDSCMSVCTRRWRESCCGCQNSQCRRMFGMLSLWCWRRNGRICHGSFPSLAANCNRLTQRKNNVENSQNIIFLDKLRSCALTFSFCGCYASETQTIFGREEINFTFVGFIWEFTGATEEVVEWSKSKFPPQEIRNSHKTMVKVKTTVNFILEKLWLNRVKQLEWALANVCARLKQAQPSAVR